MARQSQAQLWRIAMQVRSSGERLEMTFQNNRNILIDMESLQIRHFRRSSRYLSHAPEPSVEPANSETEENVVVAQPKRRQQGQVSTSKSEDHEASVQAETQDEKRRRKIKPKSQGILTQPTIYRHLQQTKATETVNKGLKRKVSALSVDQKDTLNQPHETSKPVKGGKQAKTTKH